MIVRYLIETSCEHGYFGKHITDYDDAGDTFCLTKPVVLEQDEGLVERIAREAYRSRIDPITDEIYILPWDDVTEWLKEDYRRFIRRILVLISTDNRSSFT